MAETAPLLSKAQCQYQETGEKQRLLTSFSYQAESWTRPRRIIAKVEYSHLANQRFVVSNLSRKPQLVYDDIYVLRGDVENRIKELKLEIKADRLSCHRFLANQFRLLLHTATYCLFWLLRHHLQGTELATAQVHTLRLKLLKIGARIWVHLASGYPYRDLLAGLLQNLRASRPKSTLRPSLAAFLSKHDPSRLLPPSLSPSLPSPPQNKAWKGAPQPLHE